MPVSLNHKRWWHNQKDKKKPLFFFLLWKWALLLCARNACSAACICACTVRATEDWGWFADERTRANLRAPAVQGTLSDALHPAATAHPTHEHQHISQTTVGWLCLASAPPQINNINARQILVFSLITKLGALCLNPQQSLRMETVGCVFVCAYQANYSVMPPVSFAGREYFAPVCLLLFILADTNNRILILTNSYHWIELCRTCLCKRMRMHLEKSRDSFAKELLLAKPKWENSK